MPQCIRDCCDSLYLKYFIDNKEELIHPGVENEDKIFYVIRNMTEMQSILNGYIEVLRKIEYAQSKGYVPIVDFKNFFCNGLQVIVEENEKNAWEYFFKQPQSIYSLEEIYRSKNVILSSKYDVYRKQEWPDYMSPDTLIKRYNNIYTKFMSFSFEIEQVVQEETKKFEQHRVLGVAYRRELDWGNQLKKEFYISNKGHHPKRSITDTIEQIEKYMEEFHCDSLFMSGDDRETNNIILKRFKDKCIIYDRHLPHYFENGIPINDTDLVRIEYNDLKRPEYIRRKEYLVETILLSKCTSLVGIKTSAVTCACIFNGNTFENVV